MKSKTLRVVAATLVIYVGVAALFLVMASSRRGGEGGQALFGPRVAILELEGMIMDVDDLVRELRGYRDNPQVKAVVIRVNSPGGVVGPTQELHQALMRVREAGKPVVASLGSIAASGGYYTAVAADRIYANPGTLTGSIGVIFAIPNVRGLMKWAGVEMNTITAGKMKDSGSPYREMTPEERAYFESVLHDVHEQFIEAVADGRKLKVDDVRPSADGRVFTGRQAKELKLVDELGGFDEAAAAAAKMAGIKDDPPELEYPKKDRKLLEELLGEDARSVVGGAASSVMEGLTGGMGLQYRMPIVEGQ